MIGHPLNSILLHSILFFINRQFIAFVIQRSWIFYTNHSINPFTHQINPKNFFIVNRLRKKSEGLSPCRSLKNFSVKIFATRTSVTKKKLFTRKKTFFARKKNFFTRKKNFFTRKKIFLQKKEKFLASVWKNVIKIFEK